MLVNLACKEWASVCAALEDGKQTVLLRKGGIAEPAGEFQIQSHHFFLYPTFVHQQVGQLIESAWIEKGKKYFPGEGKFSFPLMAQIVDSVFLQSEDQIDLLAPFHILTRSCVQTRFSYRRPGLHALLVRIRQLETPYQLKETTHYAGCKSWVNLSAPLDASSGDWAISDSDFNQVVSEWQSIVPKG